MASIVKNPSKLQKDHRKYVTLAVITTVLCIAAFGIWMLNVIEYHRYDKEFIIPVFAAFGGFGALSGYFRNKAGQTGAGVSGEKQSLNLLAGLPDGYTVIPNYQLDLNGRRAEIDHLIIGDSGVFIVETKNYRGTLYGNASDQELTKEKFAQKNTYAQTVRNPIFQVKREVAMLKDYLRSHGCDHFIHGIVYFANYDFQYAVQGEDPYVPVILATEGGERELRETILSNVDRNMTPGRKKQILECLL